MPGKTLYRGTYSRHLAFYKTLFFLSAILFFPAFASAQTEEEMKMLRMYFKEDELVIAPTRTPKLLSQVAENMSIVTDEEIVAMNAHTLSEVLERVTGIYIDYSVNDFFKIGSLYIQGSDANVDEKRVLVLLDGMPWNFMSNGTPVTTTIPVGIIKRLEIIKGPASSVWGSSLGGVINIVTKDTTDTQVPSGMVSASYGERHSQDYNAEVSGKAGIVGYYLYTGRQDSDGFRYNRYFERDSLYGKIDVQLHKDVRFMLTGGYSDNNLNMEDSINDDTRTPRTDRASFTTGTLVASITDNLDIEASLYEIRQKFVLHIETLSGGELLYESNMTEKKQGGSVKLVYINHMHNAVLGWDISHGKLNQTDDYTGYGLGTFENQPGISKWAVFVNDTMSIGKFAITPGLRYDDNNISGDFTSPSIGATYKLGEKTILRASVAKGFNISPLSYTSGASLGYEPNPSLKPEKVWSYQTGAETLISEYLNARVVFFQHNVTDEMQTETNETTGNVFHTNTGETRRTGVELDMETVPFYNVSLKAGFSSLRRKILTDTPDKENVKSIYDYNITVKYNDMKSLSAQLAGNYTWWDNTDYPDDNPRYDKFIWDLNLTKKIFSTDRFGTEIFLTAHNIFNSSYYYWDLRKNPRRWVEAGARLEF
jgi:vitamin B12 transporter